MPGIKGVPLPRLDVLWLLANLQTQVAVAPEEWQHWHHRVPADKTLIHRLSLANNSWWLSRAVHAQLAYELAVYRIVDLLGSPQRGCQAKTYLVQ